MSVSNKFLSGVGGEDFVPNVYEEYANMIGKLAKSYVRNVLAKNPLAVFDKGKVNNGDTIENVVIGLLESKGYDDAHALANQGEGNIVAEYFNEWLYKCYSVTLKPMTLRKVRPESVEDDVANISANIVGSLDQSAEHEHFIAFKEMLKWGATSGSYGETGKALVFKGNVGLSGGKTNYKGILKKIKDIVDGMSFVNADYNAKQFVKSTPKEDIYIVMPYSIKNAIDVDELSGVFNLSKAEIESKLIVTDSTDNYIYVVDRNAILSFTRLYEVRTQDNAQGNYWNYFLHTERMMAISPIFDACYFTFTSEDDLNAVNLVPYYSADILGKATTDLQENIAIKNDKITGTLKYVTGYTGYSGDPALQDGNFIALYQPIEPGFTYSIKYGTNGTAKALDDGTIVLRVVDVNKPFYVIATDGVATEIKEYDLSALTLLSE